MPRSGVDLAWEPVYDNGSVRARHVLVVVVAALPAACGGETEVRGGGIETGPTAPTATGPTVTGPTGVEVGATGVVEGFGFDIGQFFPENVEIPIAEGAPQC